MRNWLDGLTLQLPKLDRGAHDEPREGLCIMEAIAYLTGDDHTDHPECVCPTIGKWARLINDKLDDPLRQDLWRYVPAMSASRPADRKAAGKLAKQREAVARDWWQKLCIAHLEDFFDDDTPMTEPGKMA